jgi:hypothetical protein
MNEKNKLKVIQECNLMWGHSSTSQSIPFKYDDKTN